MAKEVNKEPAVAENENQLYGKEMIAELKKREKVINDSVKRIDDGFVKIAFSLHWIQRNEAFRARGHEDVVAYAKEKFGY